MFPKLYVLLPGMFIFQMICWLIFSCKYAERNLEVIGNREEEGMSGLQDLLEGLQSLESVLGSS
jgi:hypothetical protein